MEYRDIKTLKELPNNPRLIKNEQFEKLCKSIKDNKQFFEARPCILSNRTGELIIIAGNQRFKAAKHLKFKQVPTFLIEGLNEEQEREIIIRDNVSNGEFDWNLIANEWETDELIEWGLELPVWGADTEFSDKNKEIDTNEFDTKMTMNFDLSIDEYSFVNNKLSKINASKEIALLELLDYES